MSLNLFILCLLATAKEVFGECHDGCNDVSSIYHRLYESLLCTPVFKHDEDCCPIRYDCSLMMERIKSKELKCYFRESEYDVGETLTAEDQELLIPNCIASFRGCQGRHEFTQQTVDCYLNLKLKPGCRWKYDVKRCCTYNQICPPFYKCKFEGKTYLEGEVFYPTVDKKCVCAKGFNGELVEPYCVTSVCKDEIDNQYQIYTFCAPGYWNNHDRNTCPVRWICPDQRDRVVSKGKPSKDKDLKCIFGKRTFNIGAIVRTRRGVTCVCSLPPYLTCSIKRNKKIRTEKQETGQKKSSGNMLGLSYLIQFVFTIFFHHL